MYEGELSLEFSKYINHTVLKFPEPGTSFTINEQVHIIYVLLYTLIHSLICLVDSPFSYRSDTLMNRHNLDWEIFSVIV